MNNVLGVVALLVCTAHHLAPRAKDTWVIVQVLATVTFLLGLLDRYSRDMNQKHIAEGAQRSLGWGRQRGVTKRGLCSHILKDRRE